MRGLEVVTRDTLDLLQKEYGENNVIIRGIRNSIHVAILLADYNTSVYGRLEDTHYLAFSVQENNVIVDGFTILVGYMENKLEIACKSHGFLLYQKAIS